MDPLTLGSALLVLGTTALLAAYIPARQALESTLSAPSDPSRSTGRPLPGTHGENPASLWRRVRSTPATRTLDVPRKRAQSRET